MKKKYYSEIVNDTEGMVESVPLLSVLESIEFASQQLVDPNFMASRPDSEYQFGRDVKPEDIDSEKAIRPINRLEAGIALVNERGYESVAEKFGFSFDPEKSPVNTELTPES